MHAICRADSDLSCSFKGIFNQLAQTTGTDAGFILEESAHPSFAFKPFEIREDWPRLAHPKDYFKTLNAVTTVTDLSPCSLTERMAICFVALSSQHKDGHICHQNQNRKLPKRKECATTNHKYSKQT